MPSLAEASSLMNGSDLAAINTCLPALYRRVRPWRLLYCTRRDGISLHTLYRKVSYGCAREPKNPHPPNPTPRALTSLRLTARVPQGGLRLRRGTLET